MFQGDDCSGGWVSRGMGVPDSMAVSPLQIFLWIFLIL